MVKEELMKLSERALAKEYSKVMGLAKPIQKIPSDPKAREPRVDEMLAKLSSSSTTPDAAPPAAGEAVAPDQPSTPAAEDTVSKKKAAAKKGKKINAAKKVGRVTTIAKSDKANPYRENSKKHAAFEVYKKGGERAAVIAAIQKLGVTQSSAATWLYFFNSVVKTGKQPDWKEKKKASA
jgi:hypothetical protein